MESRYGQIGHVMRGSGKTIEQMERVSSIMLMVMFSMVLGLTTRLMAMVCIYTLTVISTEDTGNRIFNMDSALRTGLMVLNTRANIMRAENTVGVNIPGLIQASMTGIGITTKYLEMGHMYGQMEGLTRGTGLTIRCMGRESTHGRMGVNMRENTLKIKNMLLIINY